MSHESTLNHIHSTINQKLADVESRIERVKTAKKEIEKEHESGIVEIRQILHPHLNSHWTGTSPMILMTNGMKLIHQCTTS